MKYLSDIIQKKRILVIGDIMLDTYYTGDISRISPEAPVPVFQKKGERSVPGGAANVAANLVAAGQDVSIMSMIGNDAAGEQLVSMLSEMGVDTDLVVRTERETTVKTRLLANHNQQVIRLDVEDVADISESESSKLLKKLSDEADKYDLFLCSDYRKGFLTEKIIQESIRIAHEHHIQVLIDVKDPDIKKYKGADLLKPNLKELRDLTGMAVNTKEDIIQASNALREACAVSYVLTTCGAGGMVLVTDNEHYFVRSVGQEVFDVTGAGDTTISYLAVCMANNIEIHKAVDISNIAAGLQVSKVGTSAVTLQEVDMFRFGNRGRAESKIIPIERVSEISGIHKGEKIVFTNGCFDILHVGHIQYLEQAADLGDVLVVGLNSDRSVRALKGTNRPINGEADRAKMLASLGCVDYVVIFDEDTPYALIKGVQPDILVKGGDYRVDEVVGRDIVEAKGGEVKILPFVEGKSTTGIIEKINSTVLSK